MDSLLSLSSPRNHKLSTESEHSLPYSQNNAIGPYHEPQKFISNNKALVLYDLLSFCPAMDCTIVASILKVALENAVNIECHKTCHCKMAADYN